jgi:hypothetical protein
VATALRVMVVVESLTIAVLLLNLATVHVEAVAGIVGPVHGTAYLVVIALVLSHHGASRRARWLAVIPVVGGWLALRELGSPAP